MSRLQLTEIDTTLQRFLAWFGVDLPDRVNAFHLSGPFNGIIDLLLEVSQLNPFRLFKPIL